MSARKNLEVDPDKSLHHQIIQKSIHYTRQDIERHRKLYTFLRSYYVTHQEDPMFPPLTNIILDNIPILCFVPCFFLAWTLCRYNELEQININHVINSYPFQIRSSKSRHVRSIVPLKDVTANDIKDIDNRTKIIVVSYDHLTTGIKNAKPKAFSKFTRDFLDCTHIFRHIYATKQHILGVSMDEISFKLGHLNNNSTLEYIHPEFANYPLF